MMLFIFDNKNIPTKLSPPDTQLTSNLLGQIKNLTHKNKHLNYFHEFMIN